MSLIKGAGVKFLFFMHPFVKILLFIVTLIFAGVVNATFLSAMSVVLLLLIVLMHHKNYWQVLLRMRWLFLSIIIIYAFGTAGELIPQFPVQFAPSYEGLNLGLIQVERLLIALAALNLLLSASPKQETIAGLYYLLLPLQILGLNVKRFAARLTLTLHYVEELAESNQQPFNFETLNHAHTFESDVRLNKIHIVQRSFNLLDKMILMAIMLFLCALIYWNMQ